MFSSKITLAAFLTFVNAQPVDKVIDHKTLSNCAIGQCVKSLDLTYPDDMDAYLALDGEMSSMFMPSVLEDRGEDDCFYSAVHLQLMLPSALDTLQYPSCPLSTYGELQLFIVGIE